MIRNLTFNRSKSYLSISIDTSDFLSNLFIVISVPMIKNNDGIVISFIIVLAVIVLMAALVLIPLFSQVIGVIIRLVYKLHH